MLFSSSRNNTVLSSFFSKPSPDRYEWLFIIILTTALTFFLYGNVLNGYWRFDDGFHLMFATDHRPWEYFFDLMVTRAQSGANVAPWNAFFYDVNLLLFGFESEPFYLHLLILIIATSLVLFSLLRLWLPLLPTLLGVFLFLLGKPTLHMANEIMSNHYLTGMMFSLLSINFFIRYIRHGGYIKLFLSLFLYVLAMTCKEVYVPLGGILFALPVGSIKQRFIALLPFGGALIGYAFWRHAVLDAWIGGYNRNSVEISYQSISKELVDIPVVLLSDQGWGLLGLVIIAIMLLVALKNKTLNIPLILMSLFVIVPPLVSLILSIDINEPGRYLFLPWVAITILVATTFQSPTKNNVLYSSSTAFCAVLLVISSYICQADEAQKFDETIQYAEDIYRFVLEKDPSKKSLVLDSSYNGEYWAFVSSSARYARGFFNKTPSQPMIVIIISKVNNINGLMMLDEMVKNKDISLSSMQFEHYHAGYFEPFDIKPIIKTLLGTVKAGEEESIKVILSYKDGMLGWDLYPKENMTYSAILWPEKPSTRYYMLDINELGSYPWDIDKKVNISISFKSKIDDWVGVSPNVVFHPREKERTWKGKTNTTLVIKRLNALLLRLEGETVIKNEVLDSQ